MQFRTLTPALILSVLVSASVASAADDDNDKSRNERNLEKAISQLQDARAYLWQATNEYSDERGKRAERAGADLTSAITEARLALKSAGGEPKGEKKNIDKADNPLSAASKSLAQAKELLQDAKDDSENRRSNALRYVNRAMERMESDSNNNSDKDKDSDRDTERRRNRDRDRRD